MADTRDAKTKTLFFRKRNGWVQQYRGTEGKKVDGDKRHYIRVEQRQCGESLVVEL